MKKFLAFSLAALFVVYSCKKSDDSATTPVSTLASTPSAKVAYDSSNYGIYKGVFVGSSGTIVLDISNTSGISATLIVDGTTYNFTTTQTIQPNKATVLNFTSGTNSFTFTTSANGDDPYITNLNINGHPNSAIIVVKEKSTALVKCFEGKYKGTDSGVFNAVVYNTSIKGLSKSGIVTNRIDTIVGTVSNGQIIAKGNVTTGANFAGTISGNNTNGTWNNGTLASGTWSGVRTY